MEKANQCRGWQVFMVLIVNIDYQLDRIQDLRPLSELSRICSYTSPLPEKDSTAAVPALVVFGVVECVQMSVCL